MPGARLHPLEDYIAASGDSPACFAARVGASASALEAVMSGEGVDLALARRIVDATEGAVSLADVMGEGLADFMSAKADDAIDAAVLAAALRPALERLADGPVSPTLARVGAEAAAGAHAALARVTSRRGADRLVQALRPVLQEMLQGWPGPAVPHDRLERAAEDAAALYYRAPLQRG